MLIIIADDERFVRAAIVSMLINLGIDRNSILECSNGKEFLEALKILKPDIAFVDINMPLLKGLDAIEQGKVYSPDTAYYILTGYGEFEYAKKAIEMKVSDYILKPVDSTTLENILKELQNKLFLKVVKENADFQAFILSQIYNNYNKTDGLIKYKDNYFKLLYICLEQKIFNSDSLTEIVNTINTLTSSYLEEGALISIITISTQYILVTFSLGQKYESNINLAEDFFKHLISSLEKENINERKITTIEVNLFNGFDKYLNFLRRLESNATLRKIKGIGKSYTLSELELISNDENHKLCDLLDTLLSSYNNGLYTEFIIYLNKLSDYICKQSSKKSNFRFIEAIKTYLQVFMDLPIEYLALPIDTFFKVLIEHVDKNLLKRYEKEDYIESAKLFIENNYMLDIGVNTICDQLKLSPNYFSTIFHAATGKKFKKYLTDLRMLKAKKLIIETNLSIEKISREVGYFSTSHFIKLFIQYYGCSPTNMKDKLDI